MNRKLCIAHGHGRVETFCQCQTKSVVQYGAAMKCRLKLNDIYCGSSIYNGHLRGPVTLPFSSGAVTPLSLAVGIPTPNFPHAMRTLEPTVPPLQR